LPTASAPSIRPSRPRQRPGEFGVVPANVVLRHKAGVDLGRSPIPDLPKNRVRASTNHPKPNTIKCSLIIEDMASLFARAYMSPLIQSCLVRPITVVNPLSMLNRTFASKKVRGCPAPQNENLPHTNHSNITLYYCHSAHNSTTAQGDDTSGQGLPRSGQELLPTRRPSCRKGLGTRVSRSAAQETDLAPVVDPTINGRFPTIRFALFPFDCPFAVL
jgi:hypothetical protein